MSFHKEQKLQGGKYIIERDLSQGGFGIVYTARHVLLDHLVVIKVPSEKDIAFFEEEVKASIKLTEIHHPNIIRIYDFFYEDKLPCLVMEFIPGSNLYEFVNELTGQGRIFSEIEAVRCIRQIGEALVEVHEAGWVHRDINPKNVIRQANGRVILIDFGITKKISSKLEVNLNVESPLVRNDGQIKKFTEEFAPYEQITSQSGIDDRQPTVDVYSLAATLYFTVTGKCPETPYNRMVLNRELVHPQQHVPQLSSQVNQAILQGMGLKPEDRPQSIRKWLELLPTDTPFPVRSIPQQRRWLFHLEPQKPLFIALNSTYNVNYQPLEQLLRYKKWHEADRLTSESILKLLDREAEGWITTDEFRKIPCSDFQTINQLWMIYSQGFYGFSVQAEVWSRVEDSFNTNINQKKWEKFGSYIGWYKKFFWLGPGWRINLVDELWRVWRESFSDLEDYGNSWLSHLFAFFAYFPIQIIKILSFSCIGLFAIFLYLSTLKKPKGYFPTLIRPGEGILIGKGAKPLQYIFEEDIIQARQKTASKIVGSSKISKEYQRLQKLVEEWGSRASLAQDREEPSLAREALARKKICIEQAKMMKCNLDKIQGEVETAKRRLIACEDKLTRIKYIELDWEILSLTDKLKECGLE